MSEEHRNAPRVFSLLWNAKPQTQRRKSASLSCVHSVIQISQLQFVIAISNLLSCENTRIYTFLGYWHPRSFIGDIKMPSPPTRVFPLNWNQRPWLCRSTVKMLKQWRHCKFSGESANWNAPLRNYGSCCKSFKDPIVMGKKMKIQV